MHNFEKTRRSFLSSLAGSAGLVLAGAGAAAAGAGETDDLDGVADVTLRIAPVQLEVAPGHIVNTIGYNGAIPGPVIRFHEGVTARVDLFNDTDTPELVHWHGFHIPAQVDGAEEENSLAVPARGRLRYRMTPTPSGCRYVHTHVMSMSDLSRGAFTGQFAFAYIEPKSNPARYDQEIYLASHEWEPHLTTMEEQDDNSPPIHKSDQKSMDAKPHGMEVGYKYFTLNGKCLGFGDPIRVKEGERVLFHFLNASATESVRLSLSGHRLQVVALDGNPVPRPQLVDVVELGAAERVDAVAIMDSPGVWTLGTPSDSRRAKGMGVVVEYANRSGKPRWVKPPDSIWDYTIFGDGRTSPAPAPDAVIPLVIGQINPGKGAFEQWTLNGKSYDPRARTPMAKGKRHRLVFDNQTNDVHPLHLHRQSFELVSVSGQPTGGVIKDVVMVKANEKVEVDVTPIMDGLTLFHCHQQLHMDYGFKLLFDVT
jgi:FtsP/CotA-like multicopper oxidase with cupredoxin domain